ncbi:putative ABC transport system permease protein [Nocardioides sp. YR527]|uniref:ABC transporter permease n=1 Tax=Nocardioides sp. YR527 TaxID=1881028 RepID=UPI00087E2873|nr:ABC transporter permease [Nocardioides sp. YR527]SDK04417.1 putative ABC transport system permease protein [Nocardioides sp. YR527]
MSGRLAGWRLALRIGQREARRAKWRSLLVVLMIALPVAGVTAVAVTYQTYDVDTVEGLDRRLGTEAAASIDVQGAAAVRQGIDPENASEWLEESEADPLDAAGVKAVIGDRPMLATGDRTFDVRTDKGVTWASGLQTDLTDPLAAGLTRLTEGRLPEGPDEVVVNSNLAFRGPGVGEELLIPNGDVDETRKVVGIVESSEVRNDPFVAGPELPGDYVIERSTWLVGGGPVTWSDIEDLNAAGAFVLSRSVVLDPPAAARAADKEIRPPMGAPDPSELVVLVLIVVMVVLEVVLLAGPAFAVAARRQARDLALIAASGGTARQSRRVLLGMALVIGAVAAVVGSVLGVGLARLLQPLAQDQVSAWFGPFEVPWLQVLAVAVIGFAAAICAAIVPAWIASRQNVVGVLSGRRSESLPSRRSPIIGLVLVAAGVASAAFGTRNALSGIPIALGVLLCVAGVLFILPALVSVAARFSARMPLVIRFATRDADRHRTRTVPAAGAIAVTVVGVVTLGIAFSSDEKQNQESYLPSFAIGDAVVHPRHSAAESDVDPDEARARWESIAAQVEKAIPGATAALTSGATTEADGRYVVVETGAGGSIPLDTTIGEFGELVVAGADGTLPPAVARSLSERDAAAAADTLRSSGAVVFTTDDELRSSQQSARLVIREFSEEEQTDLDVVTLDVPATYLDVGDRAAPAYAVVTPAMVKKLGVEPRVVGLYVENARLGVDAETDLDEALAAGQFPATIMIERGYQETDTAVIVWLLLVTLGAVLMIGGALTATHLALNDARPDLATLSAVGARTRTRRGVAASYALVVTLLGAVPGALIGFVPGIAISYPITTEGWPERDSVAAHYLEIPWDLVGIVVVGLPLLIALIVAVTTRSRLPMVARVE